MTSNVKTASLAECLHHSTWECASIANMCLKIIHMVISHWTSWNSWFTNMLPNIGLEHTSQAAHHSGSTSLKYLVIKNKLTSRSLCLEHPKILSTSNSDQCTQESPRYLRLPLRNDTIPGMSWGLLTTSNAWFLFSTPKLRILIP
jgi:hypothetical protein